MIAYTANYQFIISIAQYFSYFILPFLVFTFTFKAISSYFTGYLSFLHITSHATLVLYHRQTSLHTAIKRCHLFDATLLFLAFCILFPFLKMSSLFINKQSTIDSFLFWQGHHWVSTHTPLRSSLLHSHFQGITHPCSCQSTALFKYLNWVTS